MSKRNIESIVSDRVSLLAACKKENARFFELFAYKVSETDESESEFVGNLYGLCVDVEVCDAFVGGNVVDGFGGFTLRAGVNLRKADDIVALAESVSEFNRVRASLESYFKADFALRHELARLRYTGNK